ncbi:MAG: transcription antitermination factor NusB [Desulfobulbus sp.]|jgi:N utilization substance protein B
MGLRRKSRELALQFLFSFDMQGRMEASPAEQEAAFAEFCQNFTASNPALPYARALVEGVCQSCRELDQNIASHSHNWRVERMSVVDRNILRIAAYELKWAKDAPAQVVINEALEIAKRYSIDDSVPFINGILDGMHGAQHR